MKNTTANAPFFVDEEKIVLNKNGIWLSDGIEITHEPTRRLFALSLKKDEAGYFLQIDTEKKRIEVEDTAYFIQRIEGSPDEGYQLWTNNQSIEDLNLKTLSYKPGRLTCRLQNEEEAKFLFAPYFEILKNLEEDSISYFIQIRGTRIDIAKK